MELGPCSVKDDPKTLNDTKVNPNSWNSNANIFFLDEPIGVGFSRAEHGQVSFELPVNAFKLIVDCCYYRRSRSGYSGFRSDGQLTVFLSRIIADIQFFETFDEFKGRAFHMAGESYGVRLLSTIHR
jgi:cathepsin A (carboxypeptidase C)